VLNVTNTGATIEEDQRQHIFTPYYQLSRKKSSRQGIGMGLSIVHNVVESLEGAIEVDDNHGDGATFTVTLNRYVPGRKEPVVKAQEGTPLILPAGIGAEKGTETAEVKAAGKGGETVLLVEDNRDLLSLMAAKVGERYTVETAGNGAQALELLARSGSEVPDVIVSDVMMDDMDGYQFLQVLQEKQGFRDIPFIFITARSTINEKLEGLKRGAIDFIYKPFVIEELVSRIESILRYRAVQREMHEKQRFTSIGMMMGGISHEIFNPLSGISGPLQYIRKIVEEAGNLGEDQAEKLEKHFSFIKKSIARIEEIITTLRALFQNQNLELEEIAPGELLGPLVEGYRRAAEDRVTITFNADPEARVRGNPFAVTQIVDNLISNAIDAVEEGGEITVAVKKRGKGWVLQVTDTGRGIPPQEQLKIFDAFYTLKERPDRIGLGLFIIKDLVSRLGWKIDVDSVVGKGTTVTVFLGERR